MTKSAWTDSDIDRLRRHIAAGGSAIRAAAKFRRKIVAVQLMAKKLGTPFPARKRFTIAGRPPQRARIDSLAQGSRSTN